MAFSLEERLIYAQTNKLSYKDLLELLCEDEKSTRKDNNYKRRKNAAKLPSVKKLEDCSSNFFKSTPFSNFSDMARLPHFPIEILRDLIL